MIVKAAGAVRMTARRAAVKDLDFI